MGKNKNSSLKQQNVHHTTTNACVLNKCPCIYMSIIPAREEPGKASTTGMRDVSIGKWQRKNRMSLPVAGGEERKNGKISEATTAAGKGAKVRAQQNGTGRRRNVRKLNRAGAAG